MCHMDQLVTSAEKTCPYEYEDSVSLELKPGPNNRREDQVVSVWRQDTNPENTGCIKKKFTVGKYSLNKRAGRICENFQVVWDV